MRRSLAAVVPRSLVVRLWLALALVGLLPVLVAWVAFLTESQRPKAVDEHYLLLAGYSAQSVRQALEEGATAIQTVAQDREARVYQGDRAILEDHLRKFNDLFPLFHHLTLIDLEGRTLGSSTYRYRGDWKGLQVFRLASSGEVAISPAHLSPGSPEPMISFAAPVRTEGGEVGGVLVGEFPIASVTSLVTQLEVGKEGRAFVLNSVDQVIAHPNPNLLLDRMGLPGREAASPTLITAKDGDRDYVYAVAPVAVSGMLEKWRVILQIPTAEAYAYIYRTQRLVLFLTIGTLAVIGLVTTGLALSISRPVRRVIAAVRRMAAGELTVQAEGSPGGEMGELTTSVNRMAQELQAKVQALKESRTRIVTVQEGVRRNIAAHLHGRVQGRLLALRGRLQELLKEPRQPQEMAQALGEVVDGIGQVAQEELSAVSRQLYPSILRRGLVPALQSLGDQFEGALTVEMKLDEELVRQEKANPSFLPEPVRLAAYRIAEEALTNVVKHTKATQVTMWLAGPSQGQLRLAVQDNGQGFDPVAVTGGLGMAAIQDYAEAVGGACVFRSAPGEGTVVTATLPVAGPEPGYPERASSLV